MTDLNISLHASIANNTTVNSAALVAQANRLEVNGATNLRVSSRQDIHGKHVGTYGNSTSLDGMFELATRNTITVNGGSSLALTSVKLTPLAVTIKAALANYLSVSPKYSFMIEHAITPLVPEPTRTVAVNNVTRTIGVTMSASPDFAPCDVGDQDVYSFDFSARLITNETIDNNIVWAMDVVNGNDPSPASHMISQPSLTGNIVSCMLGGFLANRTYRATVTVTTSMGRKLVTWSHVTCEPVS